MIEITMAQEADLESVAGIYERIHDEEEKGLATIGWSRGVYPTIQTAEAALRRADLFVMRDQGKIVAAAVINRIQVPEYQYAAWKHKADSSSVLVLHCLAVDPLEKNKGYGKAFVSYYEAYAEQHGCTELRMDTNERNGRARALYQNLGYEEVGVVPCVFNGIPGVHLVCLEKYLG